MKIGAFYQSGHKLVACYMALQQLRKIYPNIPIALYEDGSDILKPVADEFNCDYKTTTIQGENHKHSGRPVKDLESNLSWLGRIYEACTTTLKDVDWVLHYEDDVWCKKEIEIIPEFDLAGSNGPLYTPELKKYLFDRFGENTQTRGHWSKKGTLESYQACGGTIFNREKFIIAYDKINEIDWELIYRLDSRPCEWSDASLSFIMQHAGFTCGKWGDWAQYDTKNLGYWNDKTGWNVPMSEQPNVAFIHLYKHFYNYNNDELELAKYKIETNNI
jgi:hypothetical protein